MIALKVFKYKILEYCIENIFEAFSRNFSTMSLRKINITDLRVGMKFAMLRVVNEGYWWEGVKITAILKKEYEWVVIFTFKKSDYVPDSEEGYEETLYLDKDEDDVRVID